MDQEMGGTNLNTLQENQLIHMNHSPHVILCEDSDTFKQPLMCTS